MGPIPISSSIRRHRLLRLHSTVHTVHSSMLLTHIQITVNHWTVALYGRPLYVDTSYLQYLLLVRVVNHKIVKDLKIESVECTVNRIDEPKARGAESGRGVCVCGGATHTMLTTDRTHRQPVIVILPAPEIRKKNHLPASYFNFISFFCFVVDVVVVAIVFLLLSISFILFFSIRFIWNDISCDVRACVQGMCK